MRSSASSAAAPPPPPFRAIMSIATLLLIEVSCWRRAAGARLAIRRERCRHVPLAVVVFGRWCRAKSRAIRRARLRRANCKGACRRRLLLVFGCGSLRAARRPAASEVAQRNKRQLDAAVKYCAVATVNTRQPAAAVEAAAADKLQACLPSRRPAAVVAESCAASPSAAAAAQLAH